VAVLRAVRARLALRTAGLRKELFLQPVRQFDASLRAVVLGDRAPRCVLFTLLPDPALAAMLRAHEANLDVDGFGRCRSPTTSLIHFRDRPTLMLAGHTQSLRSRVSARIVSARSAGQNRLSDVR
jgi:hypothetical protein